jgi:hypothetical protein
MSALPNPLPSQQKKTPGRATRPSKLNQYQRDPQSLPERLRESSDYDTEKGYAPFFHAFNADWPRLQNGVTSCLLLNIVICKSLGRSVKKGEPRPVKTLPHAVADFAVYCRCDERSMQRTLADWHARKIAKVTPEGKGLVSIELLYRGWEALPDYKNVVSIETGESVEESPAEDDAAKESTRVELTKVPLACKAGARSKGVKIDCGIKIFHLVNSSPVDLSITAMVQAGDFVITAKVPDEWLQEAAKRASVSNGINDLNSPPRHGRPNIPSNGGSGYTPPNAGSRIPSKEIAPIHPRAIELHRIFDPVLAHSGASLLSMDSSRKYSLEACRRVEDCDHDYLARFVGNRAKIKSVLAVPDICAEALASWKASKVLDGAGLGKSTGSKKKGFAETVLQNVAQRLARDGKL